MISTDFSLPTFYERAKAFTPTMPIYESGPDPVAPSSGVFTLYDHTKTVIVTGNVTITSNIATYPVLAASLPSTLTLSDSWQEEWVLTLSDGRVETIRRDAYLCLRSLYNVVNEGMLTRRVSDLADLKPSNKTSFQGYIDEAFADIQTKLIQVGRRPYLILNSYALKDVLMSTTLQYIFEDLETYMGDGRYSSRAQKYAVQASEAYDALKLEYDVGESNIRSQAEELAPTVSVIYTNGPPRNGYFSGYWPGAF